jgi:putative ABC transport system ATP-binding protein
MGVDCQSAPAVRCCGVTKEFGEGPDRVRALRGVDLDLHIGQMTLLVGPSGCGKTTLLSVVAGILEPTAGTVAVLGQSLGTLSDREKVEFRGRNVGFVFQQFNLLPTLSAAENAAVPLIIAGMARRLAVARAVDLLSQMGMEHRLKAFPGRLSGGEQQRVAIARALVHAPRLVICDEPTSALDAQTGRAIMQLLRDQAVQPARAVIVVTHDSRVFEFADRIVTMNDGTIEKEHQH